MSSSKKRAGGDFAAMPQRRDGDQKKKDFCALHDGTGLSGAATLKQERRRLQSMASSYNMLKLKSRKERWQAGQEFITKSTNVPGVDIAADVVMMNTPGDRPCSRLPVANCGC